MMPFSDEDLKPAVENVIEKIRPMLALDGGDIKLLGIKNGKVFVQLQGACIGCSASGNTIKYGVEKQLRVDIHPEIEVINVPIGMEDRWEEMA
ncbi:NifU family protein [Nitrosophilus alvini]|uniref:NifU family protein n=1 Tax=Nitrosophilus alvini TaxID=2714855 RepID=UPI00190E2947|nr:NifU family protein [Nitrosophilus alvini]